MEEGENIQHALIVNTAGTDLMCNARFVSSWAMLTSNQEKNTKGWLIDSGCTNHMTLGATIFKWIDRNFNSKVKVGNGQYIKAEGKGDVLIDTHSSTKLVLDVLLIPEIDRNLLSIAQLLEKWYFVVFKRKECLISDPSGSKLMSVAMTDRSFVIDWNRSFFVSIQLP
ncbi:uncharacterized protein [Gossypium hirsutum]|uniref:Retrovirus-related Pol polyprotein from transposon TNT 1-94-like beta-barrel domain-containing protein n=1 Tax=Gossypium hirsutum TaxID=3635 RepID=A0ABM3A185_GOSHI|nr:uncharacterized protein LOC121217157 [Gossypium hirsutum]